MAKPANEEQYRQIQQKYKKILMPNEILSFTLRPHWRFIAVGVGLGVLLFIGLILWQDVWSSLFGGDAKLGMYVGTIIILVLFSIWTIKPIVQWIFTRYFFTTNRVMVRTGVFVRRAEEITLDKVSNLSYEKGPIDRVLRCGTLVVESSGGEGFSIDDVPDVERVIRDINILVQGGLPPNRLHGKGRPPKVRQERRGWA